MSRSTSLAALTVLLALPGAASALLLGWLVHHPPGQRVLTLLRAALALPAVITPAALAALRLQPGQRRAAIGLGASRFDRLRHLWLPQLGPGLAASLLLAALLIGASVLFKG